MNFYRYMPAPSHGVRLSVTVTTLLLAVLILVSQSAYAENQNTSFLPLKINALTNQKELTYQADTILMETLADHDLDPLRRSEAEAIADYSGNWPPPPSVLERIADTTGKGNVAAGSLTMVGKQVSIDMKVFDLLSPTTPKYFYRDADSIDQLRAAIDGIILDVLAYTGREFRIASIAPEGNKRIDSGAILRKIQSRAGGAYNPATLREDLKAIYSMGYFNDVQIDVSDTSKGKKVIFRVVEKPVIAAVNFTGVEELSEDDVRGAANIREHFILNPAKVSAAVQAIEELYKTEGYYNTKVKSEITFPSDAGAVININIEEGKKIYIKKISIEGNTAFDDDELLDEIESGEKGFFSWLTASGLLEMDVIKQDAGRIVAYYHNHGYLEAKIGEPEVRQEKEWIYLTFHVEEGPRFRAGSIDIDGDLIVEKQVLRDLITTTSGEYLNRSQLREDVMAITDFYAEKGYAFANVRPRMSPAAMENTLDIMFEIAKGDLVYINRITITGNNRTRDNVIRRELRIAEGGVFNAKALRDSSKALQRLQFFEEVNITPEPTIDPTRMNINIEVKERSTGTFSIGAGYSSVDDLIVMGSVSENNFLGRGDTLQFSANLGGSSSRYNLSYTNPHVRDSELSWGIDLYDTEREYDDYTKESTGGGIRFGYPIWEKWKIFGNYSYTDTELSWDEADEADVAYIIRKSAEHPVTSAVKITFSRDTRNKLFGATEGSKHLLSAKYGGGPFGGDAEFTKLEASTSWYFPLFWKTVFHFKGSAGQVFENEDDRLPVYERFYLGGISTVRGFDYGKISPLDPTTGDRIGGDKMWYTNLEFIFPIFEDQGVQGLAFFDAGQVLDNDEDWNLDDYEKAVGLGMRWFSPMGPISIVWGYNLDPKDDEDESVFDFSIGGTF